MHQIEIDVGSIYTNSPNYEDMKKYGELFCYGQPISDGQYALVLVAIIHLSLNQWLLTHKWWPLVLMFQMLEIWVINPV